MIELFLLQFIYKLNQITLRSTRLREWAFGFLKHSLFRIGGACRHSGNCCKTIMLYDNNVAIDSTKAWVKFLKIKPSYECFMPTVINSKISSFNCSCLTDQNTCSRYATRPTICRQYPESFFFQHGHIHDHCGFIILKNEKKIKWLLPSIKQDIDAFLVN
ncbi:MAG: YkgJ family cysteine cluster protein [Candidatus Margulisbacteria bacterium]|nr:YkgJ family cysteine cluster protein [Candidatus Margulisiibacteriota bacterium]